MNDLPAGANAPSRHASLLRSRLRRATDDLHRRLDERLGVLDLRRRADYVAFLEIAAAALPPIERALEEAGVERVAADWRLRTRAVALHDDLAQVDGAPQPSPSPAPKFGDEDAVLGALYALEGSRLGAAVLLRRLAPLADDVPTSYLRHGLEHGHWRSFLELLETRDPNAEEFRSMREGARTVFRYFLAAAERIRAEGTPA
jgi:heme oxygenase